MDWPRFLGQFTEAIDKSSIAAISKFTYLCELLSPKVKQCIEALPFSVEGYNRARAVLQDNYGKESEIVKCYVTEILDLPHITSANPRKAAAFSENLTHCVQALKTMKKLEHISGNVSTTLGKLSGIRGDLVRTNPYWESWDYIKLTEALRQWVKRNPAPLYEPCTDENARKKLFHMRTDEFKPRGCVYCGDLGHKATQCDKITEATERKRILAKKGLCFNCATKMHRAAECASKSSCNHCRRRHHTLICEQINDGRNNTSVSDEQQTDKRQNGGKLLTDGVSGEGILPVVVIKVNGITCRALIDSGAGSSYASAKLINLLNIKPSEIKRQRIHMLMSTRTLQMEFYDAKISAIDGNFDMNVKLTKVEKSELLSINNPEYAKLMERYEHLDLVQMNDSDILYCAYYTWQRRICSN